jgi:hypothetical protein
MAKATVSTAPRLKASTIQQYVKELQAELGAKAMYTKYQS